MKGNYKESTKALYSAFYKISHLPKYGADGKEMKEVVKSNSRVKGKVTKISLSKMSLFDYEYKYPEAWELISYFIEVNKNIGNIIDGRNMQRCKVSAFELIYTIKVDLQLAKESILWSFSPACKQTWLQRVPYNHLGTFGTFYNWWNTNIKQVELKKSGRLSEYRD